MTNPLLQKYQKIWFEEGISKGMSQGYANGMSQGYAKTMPQNKELLESMTKRIAELESQIKKR